MFYTHSTPVNGQSPITNLLYFDGKDLWSFDESHRLHQQYLAWLAEGNTPEPWENQ
jgi:hypothetical protein